MTDTSKGPQNQMLDNLSLASKDFYSLGTSLSSIAGAGVVLFVWGAMADIYPPLSGKPCGLCLSFLVVFGYALILPEPEGYPNTGKFRITLAEFIFGFINSFIIFSTAAAMKAI